MNENEARKFVLDLLRNYCSADVLDVMCNGQDYCQAVFIENIYFHTIYARAAKSSSERQKLREKTMSQIASVIWKTLKDGGSLEAELKNGDCVIIKLGSKTGAVEKFLLEYELKNAVQ